MAKKRNCRRTEEESTIHERAVKLRKMTDKQLVDYVDGRVEFNCGKKKCVERAGDDYILRSFIEAIGNLPGIGQTILKKIRIFAEEGGYIESK